MRDRSVISIELEIFRELRQSIRIKREVHVILDWTRFFTFFVLPPDPERKENAPHIYTGGSCLIRTNTTEWKSLDLGEFPIKHAE